MINNKNIKLYLNTDYTLQQKKFLPKIMTIYTGPLDKLFNFRYGKLDWRSLTFKKNIKNLNDYQGNAVINFPEVKFKYTRIHEPKHLHPERNYDKKKHW